jgi:hypothetical protein
VAGAALGGRMSVWSCRRSSVLLGGVGGGGALSLDVEGESGDLGGVMGEDAPAAPGGGTAVAIEQGAPPSVALKSY